MKILLLSLMSFSLLNCNVEDTDTDSTKPSKDSGSIPIEEPQVEKAPDKPVPTYYTIFYNVDEDLEEDVFIEINRPQDEPQKQSTESTNSDTEKTSLDTLSTRIRLFPGQCVSIDSLDFPYLTIKAEGAWSPQIETLCGGEVNACQTSHYEIIDIGSVIDDLNLKPTSQPADFDNQKCTNNTNECTCLTFDEWIQKQNLMKDENRQNVVIQDLV